ncbi:MAG: type VI secretion system baseplate subunit TssG, partial [Gammaproteobacteria bacterium]
MKIDESEQINHVERTDHCGQANNGVDRLLGGNETVKHSTANFFGWILALEKAARTKNNDTDFCPLGEDGPPRREAVRFINDFGMAFPTLIGQDVSSEYLNQGLIVPSVKPNVSRLVRVAFMGLIGGTGVLPLHYTRLVLSRLRQKDTALYDFFNLFTHRLVSLFYRSWMKYRLPYQLSQARLTNCEDNITAVIRHLSGVFSARKRNVEMYYAGHFARRIKSAQMLSAVLSDFLRAPVRIKQFQGRWLTVSPEARTTLCTHSIER